MLRRLPILVICLVCSTWLAAQKKTLSFEDALSPAFVPQNLRQLSWVPASNQYAYIARVKDMEYLVRGEVGKPTRDTLISTEALSGALVGAGGEATKSMPQLTWLSPTTVYFTSQNVVYRFDLAQKKAEKLNTYNKEAQNIDLEPKTFSVAYTKGNNLFIARKSTDIQVTNDKNTQIQYGQAAHRSEFGITKGTFWSPTGAALAFYKQDETPVTDYPLLDISTLPASSGPIKYPMAGGKSHHTSVGIYKTWDKSTVYLKTGEPAEQYLTNITWSPDEKFIYVAIVNRAQNEMKLNLYEASTGNLVRTVLSEKNDKWIEPEHGPIFLPGQNEEFLWFSKRDGFQNLYHYDSKGKMLGQVTNGKFDITAFNGFTTDGKKALVTAAGPQPVERHAFMIDLKKYSYLQLTKAQGTHTTQLNPNGQYVLDSYNSITVPREIHVLDMAGKSVQTLLKAENPFKEYKMGETSIFTIDAEDGTDLYCRLIKPVDFDPKKRYKALVYVYGGPHVQLVTDSWLAGSDGWLQLMAQRGYVVFTVDNRGSGNRGLAFEQANFRNLGTAELSDQLKGVDWLKQQPWIDNSRLGIYGWSFGGFMTTSMMLRHPNVFRAAVAGGPVIDWKMYEIMYTERYMDTPQENPEGYEKANLLPKIKNLNGKYMAIHGTVDDVVVWQHSLALVKKAVDENILMDYFVYPGHPHNVRGKDRVHLLRKITQYFEDFL